MSLVVERKPQRKREKSKAHPLFLHRRKAQRREKKGNKTHSIISTEHVSTDGTCPHHLPSTAAPAVTPTAGASPPTTRPAPSSTLFHAPPVPATPSGSSAERCYPARCRLEVTCCRRSSNFKMPTPHLLLSISPSDDYIAIGADCDELGAQIEDYILSTEYKVFLY